MAVLGTFGSFTTARLGIYASQASLNVTGNNIANINTKGYTRQRMDLVSLNATGLAKYANSFMVDVGYGVLCESTSQLRDPYLDIRFRDQQSNVGFTEAKLEGLNGLAHFLDEVGKGTDDFGVIANQIHEFFDAMQANADRIGTDEYDSLVRAAADSLTDMFNTAASSLETVRENEYGKLQDSVEKVNDLLIKIRDLNKQIRTQGIYGDMALELRDARNVHLDELSKLMKIDVTYSMEKIDQYTEVEKLTVSLDMGDTGLPAIKLVDGLYCGQFTMPETVPMPNPAYDPTLSTSKQYIGKDGKPTDIAREARLVENPAYSPDAPELKKYLDENGKPTNSLRKAALKMNEGPDKDTKPYLKLRDGADPLLDASYESTENIEEAARVPNPDYDANSTLGMQYMKVKVDANGDPELDANGKLQYEPTNDPNEAAKELNEAYDPNLPTSNQYLMLNANHQEPPVYPDDYTPTDDPEAATQVPSFSEDLDSNRYLLQFTALRDEKDHFMRDKYGVEIKEEPIEIGDTLLYGSVQAIRELLTEEGEFSSDYDIGLDRKASIKRGIPYYQRVLDNWAQTFADTFNAANQMDPAVVYKTAANSPGDNNGLADDDCFLDANGNHLQYIGKDGQQHRLTSTKEDGNGNKIPKEITDYTAEEMDALRSSGVLKPEYSFYTGGALFSNRGDGNDPSGITAKNISVSHAWSERSVKVLATKRPNEYNAATGTWDSHTTRQDNILHMINLIDEKRGFMADRTVLDSAANDAPYFKGTFEEMFTNISATLAEDTNITTGEYTTYSVVSLDLDNNRASVSGVDLNEEATSMMQFEKSYAAACRLLTTLDSMLDKLINGTAI